MKTRLLTAILWLGVLMIFLGQIAWAISEKDEIKIGQQGAAKAEQKFGVVKDPAMLKRAQTLGARIAAHAQRKKLKYHFGVLNSKDVNALAFPGGYIYFTQGIMKYMTDEQLAFVAGHEVSHVEHRDSVKALENAQYRAVGIALLQNFIKGADSKLSKSLMGMTNTVISNRYSQSAEFAADKNGIYLMAAAGFDPYKALEALAALQKLGGKDMSGFLNSLVSTHPITKDRLERARAIAPQAAAQYPHSKSASAPKAPPAPSSSKANTQKKSTVSQPQTAKRHSAPPTSHQDSATAPQPHASSQPAREPLVPTPIIINAGASDNAAERNE